MLRHRSPVVRVLAAQSLALAQREAEATIPVLIDLLTSEEDLVRYIALLGLAGYAQQTRPAVPAILPLLKDPAEWVRSAAIETLLCIDPAAARRAGIE